MQNFMEQDFVIGKIELACLVEAGTGTLVHRNRPAHGLALFWGGERTFCFDDRKLTAGKNTVVYFPKGSNYTIKEKASADCYAINFQLAEGCGLEPFAFKVKGLDRLLQSFKSSQASWTAKKPGYNAKIKSELYRIIYTMQAEFNIPYGNASVIQPAVDFIHGNYWRETIRVSQLASLCQISAVHLSNCFVKAFAMPPMQYINQLRMNRAGELLASQMYTVSEACFLSGFHDESYFCREFKKKFDVTPSEYKKGRRKSR